MKAQSVLLYIFNSRVRLFGAETITVCQNKLRLFACNLSNRDGNSSRIHDSSSAGSPKIPGTAISRSVKKSAQGNEAAVGSTTLLIVGKCVLLGAKEHQVSLKLSSFVNCSKTTLRAGLHVVRCAGQGRYSWPLWVDPQVVHSLPVSCGSDWQKSQRTFTHQLSSCVDVRSSKSLDCDNFSNLNICFSTIKFLIRGTSCSISQLPCTNLRMSIDVTTETHVHFRTYVNLFSSVRASWGLIDIAIETY
jgi:hypothetical protein